MFPGRAYIASNFEGRFRLQHMRTRLWLAGVECRCTWIDAELGAPAMPDDPHVAAYEATGDLGDITHSDTFILDDTTDVGRGKYVELGFALGKAKFRVLIGDVRSIFSLLCDVHFLSWEDFFAWLEASPNFFCESCETPLDKKDVTHEGTYPVNHRIPAGGTMGICGPVYPLSREEEKS